MIARLSGLALLVLLCVSLFVAHVLSQTPETPPPLFIVGRTYLVMPDLRTGEILTVVRVRANGWVDVKDETGDEWLINPAQVYGLKLMPQNGLKATR